MVVAGLVGLVLFAALVVWRWRTPEATSPAVAEQAEEVTARRAPLPALGASLAPPPVPPTWPEAIATPTSEQLAAIMKSWHAAIVTKNAETVEAIDRAFAERPDAFVTPLMESAAGDAEERVRSFSTRVLGKLRRPESAEVLRRLLSDGSAYVRFNAAWALGELGDRAAAPTLSRLERSDPAAIVRQSAGESRRKLEGG